MSTSEWILLVSTFLACSVEGVEALTVILAVGVTRGWRAPMTATIAATLALVALVVVFGPALAKIPIDALRVVVGAVLLVFGMGWLRKAILRASGYKALRDEAAIYQAGVVLALEHAKPSSAPMDWYGFTLVFKAVFLEGLEVAFIVLTFGTSAHNVPLAAFGAVLALALVAIVGAVVHQPLSRVPENTMKFAVGLMLSAFGIFWSVEGAGAVWPGADLSILGILAFLTAMSLGMVGVLRRIHRREIASQA
ncbi:MAG: hypothetical protein JWO36_6187 [Myxococcales bacterium]|nr:hypothetical protein [Myxococcales bacterium]